MLKRYLLAPGPTPVPPEVRSALASPVIYHRSPEFGEVFARVSERSKPYFGTDGPVLMVAAGGTGIMEAAVTNTLSQGDHVCVVSGGKFGERWVEIANACGLEVTAVEVEWGKAVDPAQVADVLAARPDTKAVLVQASETSTTVLHPVRELAALTRGRDCLLIVDGITSVGVVDLPMDEIGIDVLLTGSQKALMLPPGLSLIALSEKAWKFAERSDLPKYYFDLARERASLEKSTSAYTPAVSMVLALDAAYDVLDRTGGPEAVFARHALLAHAAREGVLAMGLPLLAPDSPSPAATGMWLPEAVDGKKLSAYARDVMGVQLGGGQGRLAGRVVRLGHIGYADTFDVVIGLSALEMALSRFGHDVAFGKGPAAAESVLAEQYERVA